MKFELNAIARLNNNEKFIVLNELDYNNKKYYLTMGVKNNNEIDGSTVIIMEQIADDQGYYVEKITDSNLLIELTKLFKEQM